MNIFVSITLFMLSALLNATEFEKYDPRTRDESLVNTLLEVSYQILPTGNYEYLYDLISPIENKGEISALLLNIMCEYDFGDFSYGEEGREDFRIHKDAKNLPIQAYGVKYKTYWLSVTNGSKMMWGLKVKPGESVKNLRILSPARPAFIKYTVEPNMEADDWDYASYPVDGETVLGIPDFTVSGMILGPACPGKSELFPGTNKSNLEPESISQLLRYGAPLRDRFHISDKTNTIEMRIVYHPDIDPKTFKVQPGYLKNLFDPQPGTSETIQLPIKKSANKLKVKLQVKPVGAPKTLMQDQRHKHIDRDEFEIRVNVAR